MEEARIYTCGTSNSVRNRLFKKEDAMFIKIDSNKVSGKAEVCNSEGKNGYTGEFNFALADISDIKEEDYMGFSALSFTAQEKGLYGTKKIKIFLPQLKQINEARNLLKELKQGPKATTAEEIAAAVSGTAPKARPADQPKPAEKPMSGQPAPISQETKEPVRPANQPKPVQNPEPGRPSPIAPTPAPAPAPTPAPAPAPAPVVEEKPVVKEEPVVKERKPELSEEEFQKRMDKLGVLKDCGLLGEKEYISKRLELVSEFCDLKDFNDKIQKLIALKDCGLLSDKEFEANRIDVIKECCDLDVSDIYEYRSFRLAK